MRLTDLTWKTYRIPFRNPFRTAHGLLTHRTGAIVSARTDEGYVGIGEIAPLPEQSGTTLGAVLDILATLVRDIKGLKLADILCFLEARSEGGQLPSSLICGLESALLDAIGQASGKSVAELLASGYPHEKQSELISLHTCISVNAVIGAPTLERVLEQAQAAAQAGFTCLKLKLTDASQEAVEYVAAVRAAIGPEISLRLDANEGWSFEQALFLLTRCASCSIQYIEQPLPAHDLAGMAHLRRVSPVPLAADEALVDLASARRILNAGAADVLILKPQLAGGLQTCLQIIQEADSRHVPSVLTSTLEAGIGVAATLHLAAASAKMTLPCGLGTLSLLEEDLLQEDLEIEQGGIKVPSGPGLGVSLDENALRYYH